MTEELKFYTQLDNVLRLLCKYDIIEQRNYDTYTMLAMIVKMELGIEQKEWNVIAEKLIDDQYILHVLNNGNTNSWSHDNILTTKKGHIFWNGGHGGYVNKHNKELADEKRRVDLEQSIIDTNLLLKQNQKSQEDTNRTSRIIGWSAVGVALISAFASVGQLLESINKQSEKQQTFQSYHKAHSHCKVLNKGLKKISGDTISARHNHSK